MPQREAQPAQKTGQTNGGGGGRARRARGDPHTRSEAEDAAPHQARRSDPAEGGANPQPGWSYDHSPPCGEPRMMFTTPAPQTGS